MTDPTTAAGDLIVRGTSATGRLPVGTNGQVLTADSTQAMGMRWATPGTGSQSPWVGDVDAAGHALNNASTIGVTGDVNIGGVYRVAGAPLAAANVVNAVSAVGSYADPAWITSLAWSKITGAPPTGVATVFGRSGAVVAVAGDYTAAQVTNAVSTLGSYADPAWITSLAYSKITGAPAAGVSTVFGRSGAVVAASGDYTAAQVTNAADTSTTYANPAWITALAWAKITGAPAFIADPTTTQGDLIVRSSTGVTRMGTGGATHDGQVLTANSGVANGMAWTAPAAGSTGQIQYNSAGIFAASANLFWDITNSRLGIAQPSPSVRLHVGANTGTPVGSVATNTAVFIEGPGNAAASDTVPDGRLQIGVDRNQDYGAYFGSYYFANFNIGAVLGTRAGGVDTQTIVLRGGSVGIGMSLPAYTLDVNGTIHASGAIYTTAKASTFGTAAGPLTAIANTDANIRLYDFGGGNWAGLGTDGSGNMWFRTGTGGSPDARMMITPAGALGIGLTAPRCLVDSNGPYGFSAGANIGSVNFLIAPWTNGGGCIGWNKSNGQGEFSLVSVSGGGGADGGFSFWQDNTQLLRITKAGNLGFAGTTAPQCAIDCAGIIRSTNYTGAGTPTSGAGVVITYNPAPNIGIVQSYDYGSGVNRCLQLNGIPMQLNPTNGGKVGIGVASPNYAMDIAGDCNVTGNYRKNGVVALVTTQAEMDALLTQLALLQARVDSLERK